VHASQLKLADRRNRAATRQRDEGSASKLRTVRDGLRFCRPRAAAEGDAPALFFGSLAFAAMTLAIGLAVPIFATFLATGLVPRIRPSCYAPRLTLFAALIGSCGSSSTRVARGRVEQKRIPLPHKSAPRS